jgi:DNA-binding LytR/AlgR family response regulator
MKTKILIVEDEPVLARGLADLVSKISNQYEIVGMIDTVKTGIDWLKNNECDLIISDIQLADDISFKIYEQTETRIPIIFTTAYDNYALRAFKLNSVDYILKPFGIEDLKLALEKFSNQQKSNNIDFKSLLSSYMNKDTFKTRFLVHEGSNLIAKTVQEIAYFSANQRYVLLVDFSGKEYIVEYTLEQLESELNPKEFFRINRQMIVSFKSIKKMSPASKSRLKLDLQPNFHDDVYVSVLNSPQFKNWLNN